jgi:hypothetical protein
MLEIIGQVSPVCFMMNTIGTRDPSDPLEKMLAMCILNKPEDPQYAPLWKPLVCSLEVLSELFPNAGIHKGLFAHDGVVVAQSLYWHSVSK